MCTAKRKLEPRFAPPDRRFFSLSCTLTLTRKGPWKPVHRLTSFELFTGAPGFITGVSEFEWVERTLINDNRLCDWIGHNLTATSVIGQMERAISWRVLTKLNDR